MKNDNKEPTGITISQKLQSMYDSDFTGWTEDAKNGYLTAVITLIEIIKKPIDLTVNEGMEQVAHKHLKPFWEHLYVGGRLINKEKLPSDYQKTFNMFISGWQANPSNSYNKAIEDAIKVLDNTKWSAKPYHKMVFQVAITNLIEQLKQLQK